MTKIPKKLKKPKKVRKFTLSQIFSVYTSFTLTVAVYSTLELFKFKSNEYASLLKQISLAREQNNNSNDDVFDDSPVQEDQYSDLEPESQPTAKIAENSNDMQVMMDNMKMMAEELKKLKSGNSVQQSSTQSNNFEFFEHERQGCNIRMADRGEFTNVPLLSFPGSGNTWTRYKLF